MNDRFELINLLMRRANHRNLNQEDKCVFLGEYTAGKTFSFSDTNALISNFKKPISKRNLPEWKYKGQAIRKISELLARAIQTINLENSLFVPVPPSYSRDDDKYDDRLIQVLNNLSSRSDISVQFLDCISQNNNISSSSRSGGVRPSIEDLVDQYCFQGEIEQPISNVIILDDVITKGNHYEAVKLCIRKKYSNLTFKGMFLARSIPPPDITQEEINRLLS